jgi:tRNA 2-selenouridine synthase
MAIQRIELEKFLMLANEHPVLDVRSPGEYNHAHIPGAFNLPLFSDEERKIVGTAYKQESREKAIKIGLKYFGKKMVQMVEETENIIAASDKKSETENQKSKIVLVHCWRGGMRSAGVAWLLDLYGFKVYTLVGGYKVFRNWALKQFEKSYNFNILGGYTGSGKTDLLQVLSKKGEAVIDLEGLAIHKGSAFGGIGLPKQPSQEMFENLLATQLNALSNRSDHPIWMEDESQRIGLVNIPPSLWKTMRRSPVYFLDIPFEERLNYLTEEYGKLDKEKLLNAVIRIKKRLGGLETKTAVNFLIEDEIKESFRILLKYYDKHYLKGLQNREDLRSLLNNIRCERVDAVKNAETLLSAAKKISPVS